MKNFLTKILSNIILTFLVILILSIIITSIEMSILVDFLGFEYNIFLHYVVFIDILITLNAMAIALFLAIKYIKIKIIIKILNGDYSKR